MAQATLPLIVKENFPSDEDYTYGALVEELCLIERHIRDGSWRLCSCNPEKHLPSISGLASEGYGFTDGIRKDPMMPLPHVNNMIGLAVRKWMVHEFPGGHDMINWQGVVPEGLIALLGDQPPG